MTKNTKQTPPPLFASRRGHKIASNGSHPRLDEAHGGSGAGSSENMRRDAAGCYFESPLKSKQATRLWIDSLHSNMFAVQNKRKTWWHINVDLPPRLHWENVAPDLSPKPVVGSGLVWPLVLTQSLSSSHP